MQDVLKQFAAKVTGSHKSNQFHAARIRLTVLYAILLLIILAISSFSTHSFFSSRLESNLHNRPLFPPAPNLQIDTLARNQVRQELSFSLWMTNGILFIGAVGLSYWLAGITLRPIQAAYDRQRTFLSDASHELRTPLAVLQLDLENELSRPHLNQELKTELTSHLEEVKRMGKIVNDLLLISRLDNDNPASPPATTVDLTHAITTAISRLTTYANKRQIKLITSLAPDPISVTGHYEHLLQALTNVIKNGIDYNKPNGQVVVNLIQQNHNALITITDTGIGISDTVIPHLFDRFYRADQSRSRAAGGSGLGLSIVQSIIQSYNGSVHITSRLNQGTTVTISLPLASSTS